MGKSIKIFSLILLGIFFWGLITPMAIILKIIGVDVLNLRFNNSKESYWIKRCSSLSKKSFLSQLISCNSRVKDKRC